MSRYSALYASFCEWDDDDHEIIEIESVTAISTMFQAEVLKKAGQMNRGRFTFFKDGAGDWASFVVPGRIVSLYQYNTLLSAEFAFPYREMGAILVQKVKEGIDQRGRRTVEVSGLGVEHLLTKYRHFAPIGEENIFTTTLSRAGLAPKVTALFDGAPHGNKSCTVDNADDIRVGDEIWIEMGTPSGDDGTHVSLVTGVEEAGWHDNQLTFLDRIPYNAPVDNVVTIRNAVLQLTSVAGFAVGQRVEVELDSGGPHVSIIIKVDGGDSEIHLRDGIPSAAAIGNDVTAYDYSEPATDDIDQIMAPALADGWQIEYDSGGYSGTEAGTAHVPAGDSVWDLLQAASAQTGETFRLAYLAGGYQPRKRLKWERGHVASGVTLYMHDSSTDAAAAAVDIDAGEIFEIYREKEDDIITRVYPVTSDGRINLGYCTEDAIAAANSAGFTVYLSSDLYEPDYVEYNAGVASYGVLSAAVRYGNITLSKEGPIVEIQSAANGLLNQAMTTLLESQGRKYWRVKAQVHRPLFPGQSVTISNAAGEPLGGVDDEPSTYTTLYILEDREYLESNGVIMSDLLLSSEPQLQPSPVVRLARSLIATNQAARRQETTDTRTTTIISGSGGGGVSDHGALTGLTDDDHAQYLLAAGTRTLSGNLSVNTGVTIDGVDISAHAADVAAHHALVTAGNTAIGVSGQAVSLLLAAHSGLEVSDGLRMGTPGTLTTSTTNTVGGSSHVHEVGHTADAWNTGNTLLSTNGSAQTSVKKLAIGVSVTALTNAAILSYPSAITDKGIHIRARVGQTANLFEVTSNTDTTWLKVTADGNLESGNPGFVSGVTGWQVSRSGNAEFNDLWIRGSLHAAIFTADEMNAVGGSLMVKTASNIAPQGSGSDNVLPAINGSFTLNARGSLLAIGGSGYNYFPVGSILRIKTMVDDGPGLDIHDIYVQVTAVGTIVGRNLTPTAGETYNEGYYPLTCTYRYGSAPSGTQLPTGGAIILWTLVGTTTEYTGTVVATATGNYAPYIDVYTIQKVADGTWSATPTTKPRVRVGNLDGVLGLPEQWGIALGTDLSDSGVTARYIVASDLQLRLQNIDLQIYSGASRTVLIDSSGNVQFGTNVDASATQLFQFISSTGALRVGPGTGPSMYWSGTSLSIRNSSNSAVIDLTAAGDSYFAGAMRIGTSGGIWQAVSGSFAAPVGGLKLYNVSGAGRLASYDNSGNERIRLDNGGMRVYQANTKAAEAAITFANSSNVVQGGLYGYISSSATDILLEVDDGTNNSGLKLTGGITKRDVQLFAGSTQLGLSSSYESVQVTGGYLYVLTGGVASGWSGDTNRGQFVSDFAGAHDANAIILLDTTDIAHNLTSIVHESTYGTLGKGISNTGGLQVAGYSEDEIGLILRGYVNNEVTTTATSSVGAVLIDGRQDNGGGGATSLGSTANLLVIQNAGTTRFIFKGDGDFRYDDTSSAFDEYDDIRLLRAADLSLAGRLDAAWEKWLGYNRQAIEAAGVVAFDEDSRQMVSNKRLNRLMAGALWQLHERLARVEEQFA